MSDKVAPTPTKNYDSVDTDSLNKKGYIKFLVSLSTNFMFLLALYNAVISVFLPNQVQQITDATGGDKVAALAIIMTLVSVFTFFDQPLAGALSDRTRSRFGRRTPWIIGGTFIGGMALAMVAHQTTIIGLTIFWVIAAVALNMAHRRGHIRDYIWRLDCESRFSFWILFLCHRDLYRFTRFLFNQP